MALLRCTTTFHAPGNALVEEGALLDSSEPVVKGREHLFEPVGVDRGERPVEQATARPGSKSAARRAKPAPKDGE